MFKTCVRCYAAKPLRDFQAAGRSRDGRRPLCKPCQHLEDRLRLAGLRPLRARGRRANPRSGDKKQARRRIAYLVASGRIPPARTLPCATCGGQPDPAKPSHTYAHHLGYGASHHDDVEPLCAQCRGRRTRERGERHYDPLTALSRAEATRPALVSRVRAARAAGQPLRMIAAANDISLGYASCLCVGL